MPTALNKLIRRAIIIAHKEDTSSLERSLASFGFEVHTQRMQYTEEELNFSALSRCFLNHSLAWNRAASLDGYTLICEADFVPCRDLGNLPAFWPEDNPLAWGYLYQGSPRAFARIGDYLRGHAAPLVAYVVNPDTSKILVDFSEEFKSKYDLKAYTNFESHVQWWLMGRGAEAYIPLVHYGEHGGMPNYEHTGRQRFSGAHRADNLAAPLSFLPVYAGDSLARYVSTRIFARILGFTRILAGKWYMKTEPYPANLFERASIYFVGVKRLLLPPFLLIRR